MPRSQGSGAAEFERRRIQQEREAERERKAAETARKAAEREARQAHVAGRLPAAEQRTADQQLSVAARIFLLKPSDDRPHRVFGRSDPEQNLHLTAVFLRKPAPQAVLSG